MEHLYTLRKFFTLTIALLTGYAASSQCGPLVQDFNNTGGTMAGFESSTYLSSAPGFTWGSTGQNGYLQRCDIPSAGTVYTIVSPTYQSLTAQTNIGWGFTLSGDVEASQVLVFLQYIDNTGHINSVLLDNNTATPYTGSGANHQLVVCQASDISMINGFTAGEKFRIAVQVTAETASANANQCMVFDDFHVTGSIAQSPLPVAFVGFGANKTSKGVELIWNVAGERDVQTYIVERSATGNDFATLGEVSASHSSSYSFLDNQPLTATVFYRIKEVDIDGKSKYSTIVRLNLDKVISLRAYPSPAKDQVTIEHSVSSKGNLSITTTDGRLIKQIDVKPDLYQTVINISNLKAGLYIVRFVNGNGQTETIKLLKE